MPEPTLEVQHAKVNEVLAATTPMSVAPVPDMTPEQLGSVKTALTEANAIPWWKSATQWSTIVAMGSGLLALFGHTIDAHTQSQIAIFLYTGADVIMPIASTLALHFRNKTSVAIKPQILPPILGGKKETPLTP